MTSRASELLNGTSFDLLNATTPQLFTCRRKLHFNRTERTIIRIVVVQLRVAAKSKSPEGMTFVPVFITDNDLVLNPGTCDVVGECIDGEVNLNPTFIHKHENGTQRVKALRIKFELGPDILKDLDLPDWKPGLSDGGCSPVARKVAEKQFPPFLGKRPRMAMKEVKSLDEEVDEDDSGEEDHSDPEKDGEECESAHL